MKLVLCDQCYRPDCLFRRHVEVRCLHFMPKPAARTSCPHKAKLALVQPVLNEIYAFVAGTEAQDHVRRLINDLSKKLE